jgi:hypothetical protein
MLTGSRGEGEEEIALRKDLETGLDAWSVGVDSARAVVREDSTGKLGKMRIDLGPI